jgi:hypothetical protein
VYLQTDEAEEAVSALEMAEALLATVSDDAYQWKWAIISLHNAAQGFMLLSLRGSNGFDVISKKDAQAWTVAIAAGKTPPAARRLETYLTLYSRTKGPRMQKFVNSRRFTPVGEQDNSIKRLNSLRNEFIHFLPKGWSLEVSGLPDLFSDVLAYIEFLGWACGNVVWAEPGLELRAQAALGTARIEVDRLAAVYASPS